MCASDDGQAIANYNIQNLRKSGEALDEVSRFEKGQHFFFQVNVWNSSLVKLILLFHEAEVFIVSHQVYNTLCRIFPRRFVLPIDITHDTPYNQNLNNRPNSTASSVRFDKNKVGDQYHIHVLTLEVV